MKQILVLFFFSLAAFSQKTDMRTLLAEGGAAFGENNFVLAKEIYTKAIALDYKNRDAWYNLAAAELSLGETDSACEHFYRAYLLYDSSVIKNIKEFCPNFRNGSILSIDEVDEQPKFISNGKEYPLYQNKNLHPVYIKALTKELRRSQELRSRTTGIARIVIKVNKHNAFDGGVFATGADKKDDEFVKTEIMRIMKTVVAYISARHKGQLVDIWEQPMLPINFR